MISISQIDSLLYRLSVTTSIRDMEKFYKHPAYGTIVHALGRGALIFFFFDADIASSFGLVDPQTERIVRHEGSIPTNVFVRPDSAIARTHSPRSLYKTFP